VSVGIPRYTVPNCSRMEICRGGETAALPPMKPKPTIRAWLFVLDLRSGSPIFLSSNQQHEASEFGTRFAMTRPVVLQRLERVGR
jgi:hypothetical protein